MSETQATALPIESEDDARCKATTKAGSPCKNKAMKGYLYCNNHQATCSYSDSDGAHCRNFVIDDSNLCIFHLEQNNSQNTKTVQQYSLIHFIKRNRISRRAFFTSSWHSRAVKELAASLHPLKRPIQIVGGFIGVGIAEYLLSDILDYFKETHGIEYLLPLSFKKQSLTDSTYKEISDTQIVQRVLNKGEHKAHVLFEYIDYNTGGMFSSSDIALDPNQSYIDLQTMNGMPSGFQGGTVISADQPVEARNIVRLKVHDSELDVNNSQFLVFTIPISDKTSLIIQNIIAMIAIGKQGKLSNVSDVPCVLKGNKIYFDRKAILYQIDAHAATEGICIVQLEGKFLVSEDIHELAYRFLPEYSKSRAEVRFETTAEMLAVAI